MRVMRSRCGVRRGLSGEATDGRKVIVGQEGVAGSVMTGELVISRVNTGKRKYKIYKTMICSW